MAKKQIKYPVPDAAQLWRDAVVLLQYAHRLEKDPETISRDHEARVMLSRVSHEIREFQIRLGHRVGHVLDAAKTNQLARVFKKIKARKLGDTDYDSYERTIRGHVGGFEDEDGLLEVPQYFFLKAEDISDKRGPIEAAKEVIGRAAGVSPRLLQYFRKDKRGSKLRILESVGCYFIESDFFESVLVKIFSIPPGLVQEVTGVLVEFGHIKKAGPREQLSPRRKHLSEEGATKRGSAREQCLRTRSASS